MDGHLCEHGWQMRASGHVYTCHSYCCYHRSARTGRRTLHSYCRVEEFGHYALKACRPQYLAAAEAPPVSIADLGELEQAERDLSAEEAEALAEARAAAQWRLTA